MTGTYQIKDPCAGDNTFNSAKIYTRCDMETKGGGWIVIQRRITNGNVNFARNWKDYVDGFGDLNGEFWIGLNNIYQLTTQQSVELQISVWNDTESAIIWNYRTFRISGPEDHYRLTLGGGIGNGYDAFVQHNGYRFSTFDRDNDGYRYNCAHQNQGGWWYRSCYHANLNGRHQMSGLSGVDQNGQLLRWYNGSWKVYTNSVMMVRRKNCGFS